MKNNYNNISEGSSSQSASKPTDEANSQPSNEGTTVINSDTSKISVADMNNRKDIITILKSKWLIISLFVILFCGALAWWLIRNSITQKEYQHNLKEFVLESGKASMASAYICEDLRSIWHDYIFEDKEYFINSSGTFTRYSYDGDEYCSSFSEAISRKIRWNERNLPSTLFEPYEKAKKLYKELTPPISKYKDIHGYVKQMFKAMERLHELSTNPTGNLSTYSSECNSAVAEYTSALSDLTNESNIDFSEDDSNTSDEDDEFSD